MKWKLLAKMAEIDRVGLFPEGLFQNSLLGNTQLCKKLKHIEYSTEIKLLREN